MYVTVIRRQSYNVSLCYEYQEGDLSFVCMLRISGGRAFCVCMLRISEGRASMCMHVTDIMRESYHVYACYGYQEGELSCVCIPYGYREGELSCVFMLRLSGGRAIVCMHATDIRRESYNVYVCYGYQEGGYRV